jgi:hypothetical protein
MALNWGKLRENSQRKKICRKKSGLESQKKGRNSLHPVKNVGGLPLRDLKK